MASSRDGLLFIYLFIYLNPCVSAKTHKCTTENQGLWGWVQGKPQFRFSARLCDPLGALLNTMTATWISDGVYMVFLEFCASAKNVSGVRADHSPAISMPVFLSDVMRSLGHASENSPGAVHTSRLRGGASERCCRDIFQTSCDKPSRLPRQQELRHRHGIF